VLPWGGWFFSLLLPDVAIFIKNLIYGVLLVHDMEAILKYSDLAPSKESTVIWSPRTD
jgi:hypothetical protein